MSKVENKSEVIVSVIIPALNEAKYIGALIESLNKQTVSRNKYEIIPAVNFPNIDDTEGVVKKYLKKGMVDKYIKCKKLSAGHSRNEGAKVAVGKYFAFPDADTVVCKTWIAGVIHGLEEGVACTGPVSALERDSIPRTLAIYFWQFITRTSFFFGRGIIPGHNFGVRKDVFYKAGKWLDANQTNEDNEFSVRLHKFGKFHYVEQMALKTSVRRLVNVTMWRYFINGVKYFLFRKSMTWEEWREDY